MMIGFNPRNQHNKADQIEFNKEDSGIQILQSVNRPKKTKYIPDELLQQILANLPVKTLIRFHLISKPWRSLISHPSFQQNHYRRQAQKDPLLLLTRDKLDKVSGTTTLHFCARHMEKPTFIDNFSIPLPKRFYINLNIRATHGLLCISDTYDPNILICNPATREIITLPPPHCDNDNIGFGYAASTNEFKVVRFFKLYGKGTKYGCEVFTLGTSEWREAKFPPQKDTSSIKGVPFVHGAIHLLPLAKNPNVDISIHAFDIQTEEYTSIPLPETYPVVMSRDNFAFMYLTDFGGLLCLNFCFHSALELWLLKDYDGGKWVKECFIDFTLLASNTYGEVLTSMGDGTILMNIGGVGGRGWSLYIYNPRDKTFTPKAKENYSATLYFENLLSLEGLCSHLKSTGDLDYYEEF